MVISVKKNILIRKLNIGSLTGIDLRPTTHLVAVYTIGTLSAFVFDLKMHIKACVLIQLYVPSTSKKHYTVRIAYLT